MKIIAILILCCASACMAFIVGMLYGREMQRQECREEMKVQTKKYNDHLQGFKNHMKHSTEFWQKAVESQRSTSKHFESLWRKEKEKNNSVQKSSSRRTKRRKIAPELPPTLRRHVRRA